MSIIGLLGSTDAILLLVLKGLWGMVLYISEPNVCGSSDDRNKSAEKIAFMPRLHAFNVRTFKPDI
jgi:hypothetical protein